MGTPVMPLDTLQGSYCCTCQWLVLNHAHPYKFPGSTVLGMDTSMWGGLQGSPISAAVTAARQQAERADSVMLCSSSPVIYTGSG